LLMVNTMEVVHKHSTKLDLIIDRLIPLFITRISRAPIATMPDASVGLMTPREMRPMTIPVRTSIPQKPFRLANLPFQVEEGPRGFF
jgi:hypothetical protein